MMRSRSSVPGDMANEPGGVLLPSRLGVLALLGAPDEARIPEDTADNLFGFVVYRTFLSSISSSNSGFGFVGNNHWLPTPS